MASPPDSRLWYVWVTLAFSNRLQSYVFALFNYISWGPLPLQNPGLVPTGKFLMTSVHVICGLDLSNQNSAYAYTLEVTWKSFLKTFFFLENTCGCVLGIERVCPRKGCPWPRALCPRLHLWSSATHVFLRIFEWSSQTNEKPGHGIKTGTYGKSNSSLKYCVSKKIITSQKKSIELRSSGERTFKRPAYNLIQPSFWTIWGSFFLAKLHKTTFKGLRLDERGVFGYQSTIVVFCSKVYTFLATYQNIGIKEISYL